MINIIWRECVNQFQESLNELIIENNLNKLKLAQILGISSNTLSGYFVKNYYPRIEIAIKMCNYFDCSLDYLFGITDKRKPEYTFDNSKLLNNFNNNLKSLFKKNNLSVASAMKAMQLDEYTYYNWKKGKFPNTTNILVVSKFFGVSIDFLLGYEC